AALSREIDIVPIRLTRLVEIRVDNPDPVLATNIANTIARTFVEDNMDLRRSRAIEAVKWMDAELIEKERQVREADEALQRYKEERDMASLEADQNLVLQSVQQAQLAYDRAQSEATAAQQTAQEVARIISEGTPLDVIPEIAQSMTVRDLKAQLSQREALLQGLLTKYKEKWPDVIQARQDVESLRDSLDEECQKIYES